MDFKPSSRLVRANQPSKAGGRREPQTGPAKLSARGLINLMFYCEKKILAKAGQNIDENMQFA